MERTIELFLYSQTVFIALPWEGIFVQDTEHQQSFGEAVQTFHAMAESYGRYGNNLIRLPLCGPDELAEIILFCLQSCAFNPFVSLKYGGPGSCFSPVHS